MILDVLTYPLIWWAIIIVMMKVVMTKINQYDNRRLERKTK